MKTKTKKRNRAARHTGSTFDSFLEEEGIREEVEAVAVKSVISWQLGETMRKKKKTKQALARELNKRRSQLDPLLDSEKAPRSLYTIDRGPPALCQQLIFRIPE